MSDGDRFDLNIDVFNETEVSGWVADRSDPANETITLKFDVDGVPGGLAVADLSRKDVAEAGRGPERCGFYWRVPDMVARAVERRPIEVAVSASMPTGAFVPVTVRKLNARRSVSPGLRQHLRPALEAAVATVTQDAMAITHELPPSREPARYPLHERLFTPVGEAPEDASRSTSTYIAFQNTRLRMQIGFPLDGSETARNRYLKWYLDGYLPVRRPLRAPLGATDLAYLNEPLRFLGLDAKVSRVSMSYALAADAPPNLLPLRREEDYERFVYWWSVERSAQIFGEDCLVPQYYVDVLSRVRVRHVGWPWALSVFMERRHEREGRYHVLDPVNAEHRLLFYVWVVLEAASQPGWLRFVPQRTLTAIFEGAPGQTLFDQMVQAIHPSGEALGAVFDAARFERHLARRGFDLTRRRFLTLDAKGNRFEAARFPLASEPAGERVPVQVIGPIAKSSGLGQATRLSAATLRAAGYQPNVVDFDLDNPSPAGFATNVSEGEPPRPARVNLIHLNGETLPMALAYMRDVFNGAYNIGYFFWELSKPAEAQRLAIELCDELWLASDYGVSIYEGETGGKPVTNVGMAFESVEDPGRETARAFVRSRLPVGPETFVFLSVFDSLSYVERKNPHGLIAAFQSAFGAQDDVLLVLKTHNRDYVVTDGHQERRWERLIEDTQRDPRIVIVNETLRYGDLMKLKKGCDAYVSLHRSEGWGFGLIEAMGLKVPVLSTGYSGSMEFTRPDHAWLVDYDLVHPGAYEYLFVEEGHQWAAPRHESAAAQMRAVRSQAAERTARAERAYAFVRKNFSLEARARRYAQRLGEIGVPAPR